MRSFHIAVALAVLTPGGVSACGDDDGGDQECVPGGDEGDETADGCRLSARTTSFAGGEPVQIGWYDEGLDAACEFGVASDGELRCLPERAGHVQHYSGADCAASTALVHWRRPVCGGDAPAFTVILDFASCPVRTRIFRVGPEYDGDAFYDGTGASYCVEVEPVPGYTFYRLGEEVEPDEMVAAEREARGEGRLQAYVLAAEDGARQLSGQFRDTELGDDCRFDLAGDGSLRCVPGEFSLDNTDRAFSDDACSQQVGIAPSCSQSTFGLLADRSSACEERWSAYELGDPLENRSSVYVEDGGKCSPVNIVPDDGMLRMVRPVLGAVEPSALAGAELEVRGEGRVRGRWAVLDDGLEAFLGWLDTELETGCDRRAVEGGATICAPIAFMVVDDSSYFSDATCTQQVSVARGSEACAALDGAIAFLDVEGCPGRRFFRTGGPIEGDLFKIGVDLPPCRPVDDPERATLRTLGDEIDPASLEPAE